MRILFIVLVCIFLGSCTVNGNEFIVTLENDLFYDTDRHYTHGTKFINIFDDAPSTPLDDFMVDSENSSWGLGVAQYMYTPSDISVEELQVDDRPYGGWLYLEALLMSHNDKHMDLFGFNIGVTGEKSQSGETQSFVHDLTGSQEPNGWDNQIGTELGINLLYQRKYRLRYKDYIDLIPQGGCSLGNIFGYANAGCTLRMGYNIPDDFGILRMEPTTRAWDFGVYAFAGCEGRYVFRNIFLDGNTFEDSHSVEREDWMGDFSFGAGLDLGNFEIIYSSTLRSKEFVGQDEGNKFGSIILAWNY